MTNTNEPVSLTTAITAALVATVNVLAIVFDWSTDVTAALNLAIGAWVAVVGFWLRANVTPTRNVALTTNDVALIEAGRAEADGA